MPNRESLLLTAIIVQCCKLGALVSTASTVTGFHLQLIPGGLTQLCQEHICGGVGTDTLPCPCTYNQYTDKMLRLISLLYLLLSIKRRNVTSILRVGIFLLICCVISQNITNNCKWKKQWLTLWSKLECDSTDWTASTGPALQVEAGVAGVNVGEDWLILVELGFCKRSNIIIHLSMSLQITENWHVLR